MKDIVVRFFKNYRWVLFWGGLAYAVQALAYPVHEGRDFDTYYLYFRDLWVSVPEYPIVMLFRTPVTPLLFGALLGVDSEILLYAYFLGSYLAIVVMLFGIACRWGKTAGYLSIFLLFSTREFFFYFNSVASENPSALFAVIGIYIGFRIRNDSRVLSWVSFALFGWLLILVRPSFQVFGLFAGLPVLFGRGTLVRRLCLWGSFCIVFLSGILGYSSYNYLRYGAFEVGHLGPAHMPFFRLFIHEKIVRPDNGPASSELAEIVREDVLTRPVFQEYGVTEELFFEASTMRFWIHLVDAMNLRNGYLDNNRLLKEVSREARSRYPLIYWFSYVDKMKEMFEFPERSKWRPIKPLVNNYADIHVQKSQEYRERGLRPTGGDLIPGTISQLTHQPEGWNYDPSKSLFSIPPWHIEEREGVHVFRRVLHFLGHLRPSISICLLFGLIGFLRQRSKEEFRDYLYLSTMVMIVFGLLALTGMGNPILPYRYPFDPVFLMWGAIGLSSFREEVLTFWERTNSYILKQVGFSS